MLGKVTISLGCGDLQGGIVRGRDPSHTYSGLAGILQSARRVTSETRSLDTIEPCGRKADTIAAT